MTTGTLNWREVVSAQLRERDAVEKAPFETIITSHVTLWNANQALIKQREKLKASVSSAGAASQDGASSTSGPSAEKTKDLERKIEQLQSELTASYKKEAREATSQLALEAELRQLQSNEQTMKAAMERLRLKLKETQALLEEEQRSGGRAREEATTFRDELLRTRRLLEQAESKNRQLTKENANLLERILSEKLKMADELNQMSQMYEELQQRLKQRDAEDKKQAPTTESASSNNDKDGGGEEEDGGAAGDGSKPVAGQVKGGVKRTQAGTLGMDMAGLTAPLSGGEDKSDGDEIDQLPSVPTRFQAHDSEVPMIRYDETGSRLFTCSCDGTIKAWDAWGGSLQKTLRSPVDVQLMGMDVKDRVVIATGSDRTVRVWNLETERVFHTLTGHASKLYACRLTPDARTAVSGGTDRKVMTWDIASGNRVRMISCSSIVNAVAVSEDGSYIATGHQDTSLRMWDLRSGKMVLAVTDCHSNTVTSVEFTQGGKILTNSRDNTIALVDIIAGKAVARFGDMNYKSAYNWSSADASPSSSFVGTGGSNGQVFIWSTKGVNASSTPATKAAAVLDHSDNKRIAAFSFNPSGGGRCASADENGSVVLWKSKKQ